MILLSNGFEHLFFQELPFKTQNQKLKIMKSAFQIIIELAFLMSSGH